MTGLPFERWEMKVRFLSPVHVGSGWELTPEEYVLRKEGSEHFLEVIDLGRLLQDLDEVARAESKTVLDRGDTRGIQDWIVKRYDPRRHQRFWILVQPAVAKRLQEDRAGGISQCIVALSARHPVTGDPYIPGSAIKGALRTAVLARQAVGSEFHARREDEKSDRRFQQQMLGIDRLPERDRFGADPFRQLGFEDVPLEPNAMLIDRIQIVHEVRRASYGGREAEGILMFRDNTLSLWDGEEIDAIGSVRVNTQLCERRKVTMPLGVADIVESCRMHYLPAFDDEWKRYGQRFDRVAADRVRKTVDALGPDETIVRIGRHSHFECMTVPSVRVPPKRGFGKTRSYVGGQIPLGWCRLSFRRIV